MFVIRKEQMEVLEAHLKRAYEGRLARKIARDYPERLEGQGEEPIRRFVRSGILNAERYGITEDEDVEAYVVLLARHRLESAAFEKAPELSECRELLEDKELPGDAKVCLLAQELAASPPGSELNSPTF